MAEQTEGNGEDGIPYNVEMKIGIEGDHVLVFFSESISVLGLPIAAARGLARALYDNCDAAEQMLKQAQKKQ